MPRIYRFIVGPREAAFRLDRYLVRHLPQTLSRVVVQRAISEGQVTVGDQAAKAHRLLKAGDMISARFDQVGAPAKAIEIRPELIPLAVVYEDDQVLVVNKPPGLVTHPAPGHWSGTLVNAILWHLRNAEREPTTPHSALRTPPLPRAGIVHRLDKDTSGLLIVAKTEPALRDLAKQLKTRTISRRYLAIVEGHVPFEQGTIDAAIGRHLTHRKQMSVRYLGGRRAVTHYRVLKRLEHAPEGHGVRGTGHGPIPTPPAPPARREPLPGRARPPPPFPYTVLEVSLETGRTHQVRVHLAHLGYPILGDVVYGHHSASDWKAHGIARQLLHALAIRFVHPTTHRTVELRADPPEDMTWWISADAVQ